MYDLTLCFEKGLRIKKNVSKAIALKKLAEIENVYAIDNLVGEMRKEKR